MGLLTALLGGGGGGGGGSRQTSTGGSDGDDSIGHGGFLSKMIHRGAKNGTKIGDMDKRPATRSSSDSSGGYDNYKRGGRVRKTGLARLHKGERVLTRKQARRYRSK